MIEVLPADNLRTFKNFLYFPYQLYRGNSLWVPPLFRDVKEQFSPHNPFFQHAEVAPFIAQLKGKTVGRITAIYNRAHINFTGEKAGFFGFFDCINESMVAKALIEKAGKWLREKGIFVMRGPMNFSSNEEWGLLIEGFDKPPMLMMPYNFPYIASLLEGCGLTKAKDLFAYIIDVPETLPKKTFRVATIAEKQGIRVRPINLKNFQQEMLIFKRIYNAAWEKNWGFIPMTDEEIEYRARKLKPLIVPELSLIAECNGRPIGLMMFLPDFNYVLKKLNGHLFPLGIVKALWYSRRIKDIRLLLLGIRSGFRRRGVDSLLLIDGLKALKEKGFHHVEFSWVLEDNFPVQRIIETVKGKLYKKYRVYEMKI
jgi:hypothetical protein